jgi:hypothetical protein
VTISADRRPVLVLLPTAATFALFLMASAAWAGSWQGQELEAVIEKLRRDGLPVLYSSGLVRSGMPVRAEPTGSTPVARLGQVLEPYGLSVRAGPYGSILVVRSAPPVDPVALPGSGSPTAVPELIVTTSRYQLQRQPVLPVATLASTDLERLPDLGDDPMRAATAPRRRRTSVGVAMMRRWSPSTACVCSILSI